MEWSSLTLEELGLDDYDNLLSGQKKSSNSWKISENTLHLLSLGRPVIMTFPRSGRHWLMLALECYFRESISYDDSPWSDNTLPKKVIFAHEDQCDKGYPPMDNYLCLYRKDIVACTFSRLWKSQVLAHTPDNIKYVQELRKEKDNDTFLFESLDWSIHWFRKYHPLFNDRNVVDVITFEEMLNNLTSVLQKVCNFLGEEYIEYEGFRVLRDCTKEVVSTCCESFEVNLTTRYKKLQAIFREEYSDRILDYLITQEPRLEGLISCG